MEATPSALAKILVPRAPLLLKTTLLHALSLSHTSSKWDLRTSLTVNILRHMLGPDTPPTSITHAQRLTTKDPGVKGPMWVSRVKLDVEGRGEESRNAALNAIREMGDGSEEWDEPLAQPLEAEWVGRRGGVGKDAPEPADLSETEKYQNLMKEAISKVTVLYFHGGAMYLLDPATYRPTASRIARDTGGRVFNVRYRLAPQNPFPAALLDAFTAYLSLLAPPPGAPHAAVPANEIVFAGDSAGGMLCAALLQLLLQLHRSHAQSGTSSPTLPTTFWYGNQIPIPLPAGLALTSPWLDVTRSLPSIESFAKYDYLPPPSVTASRTYPRCAAWPASPPRADLYCATSAMLHPLVSPLAARDWRGAPPVLFGLGEEMLRDEDAVVARRMHAQGVSVRWREFEAMPHCFGMMLEGLPASEAFYQEMAAFMGEVVRGEASGSDGVFFKAKSLERRVVGVEGITELGDEVVERFMGESRERTAERWREMAEGTKSRL